MRYLLAIFALWFAVAVLPDRQQPRVTGGERKVTYNPGTCPDGADWYLYDSTDTTVTVACYDPDYQPDTDNSEDTPDLSQ